jgi:acetyl-CoA carboxylase biotin carboxylase subunit
MEMNTRLRWRPVTEMTTGVDIVRQQILVAANHHLELRQDEVRHQGHAIEMRINAEDPERDFQPDPKQMTVFERPESNGVRIDTHLEPDYCIPPFYDSMIAS